MILSEDGRTTILGDKLGVIEDFSVTSAAVTIKLLDEAMTRDMVKCCMIQALISGMENAFDQKDIVMPAMEEIRKAADEFFDKFRDMLKDE